MRMPVIKAGSDTLEGRRTTVSLAVLAAAMATPALAQNAPQAQAEAAPEGGIAEIVVTAQKRAENVQDVPIAISAFTAEVAGEPEEGAVFARGMAGLIKAANPATCY